MFGADCLKQKKRLDFDSKIEVTKGNAVLNRQNSTRIDITIRYQTEKKSIQEEILVYDTAGMISQVGGIISLFIGISFFSLGCEVLDFVKNII